MAFGRKKDGTIKRPSRILLVLAWILVVPFVALAVVSQVASPLYGLLNGVTGGAVKTGEEIEAAHEASRDMTQEVES